MTAVKKDLETDQVKKKNTKRTQKEEEEKSSD